MAEKKKKHEFSHTTIEHHSDKSHTVHHHHASDSKKDKKHAVADLDSVHDSMQDHLGEPPTEGDIALNQGQHGIPAEHAQAAGIPMPTAAAPVGAVSTGAGQ